MLETVQPSSPVSDGSSTVSKVLRIVGAVVTMTVLARVLVNDLIWDDRFLITYNETLGSPKVFMDIFVSTFWSQSSHTVALSGDYYRPITSLVLWITGFLFGPSAPAFHFLSMLAAIGCAVSLAVVTRRMQDEGSFRTMPFWVALIMLIHPLNIEVLGLVGNISDYLALQFILWTLILALPDGKSMSIRRLTLIALFSALAAGSKETGVLVVAIPFVVQMMARRQGLSMPDGFAKLRMMAAIALPVVLFLILHRLSGASSAAEAVTSMSFRVVFLALGQCLQQLLVISPNSSMVTVAVSDALPWLISILSLSILIGLSVMLFRRDGRIHTGPVIVLVAFALMIPALVNVKWYPDYIVIPTRYFFLPLAASLPVLAGMRPRLRSTHVEGILCAAVLLMALVSWIRMADWKSELSFFQAEFDRNPESGQAAVDLADVLITKQAFSEAEKVIQSADTRARFDTLESRSGRLYHLARIAFARDGDTTRAGRWMQEALRLMPTDVDYLTEYARILAARGCKDAGFTVLENALAREPFSAQQREYLQQQLDYLTRLPPSSVPCEKLPDAP